jgi:membrane protein
MDATADPKGRRAESPWQIPLKAWKEIAARTWSETWEDNVGLVAAGVAFYGFLALVPLLGAIVLIYGLMAEPMTVVEHMRRLMKVLPDEVAVTIAEQLLGIVATSGGRKGLGLVFALAVALYGASNGAGAIMTALNIAYEEGEKRSLLRYYLIALTITLAAILLALAAVLAFTALGFLEQLLPRMPEPVLMIGKIAAYGALLLGAAAAAATLFRYGPSREDARWEWLTPGSLFAALGWLLLTLAFGFYVTRVANLQATYGSLAAVAGLITWMYLSAYVFLIGAERLRRARRLGGGSCRGMGRPAGGSGKVRAKPGDCCGSAGGGSQPCAAAAEAQGAPDARVTRHRGRGAVGGAAQGWTRLVRAGDDRAGIAAPAGEGGDRSGAAGDGRGTRAASEDRRKVPSPFALSLSKGCPSKSRNRKDRASTTPDLVRGRTEV